MCIYWLASSRASALLQRFTPSEVISQPRVVIRATKAERRELAVLIGTGPVGNAFLVRVNVEQVVGPQRHRQVFAQVVGHVQVGDPFGRELAVVDRVVVALDVA